jgi:hypothetical protein
VFLVHAYPELDNVPLAFFHAVSQSSWHNFSADAVPAINANVKVEMSMRVVFIFFPFVVKKPPEESGGRVLKKSYTMTPWLSANLFYDQGNPTVRPGKNKGAIRAVIFADYDANCAACMGFFKSRSHIPVDSPCII